MSDVVVLGSLNLDHVVRAARLPGPGETVAGDGFTTVPGGKGLNQAVAAHRAGAGVTLLGALGADPAGEALHAFLVTEGLATAHIARVAGASGTAHITVDAATGENTIVVVPGANGVTLPLDAARERAIARSGALVMQLEVPQPMLLAAARVAAEHGVRTVLTPAPVQPIDPRLLELVDLLVPNEHEAMRLAGAGDPESAAIELSGGRLVVVTLGAEGVLCAEDGRIVGRFPARSVAAVDTTAAGDTFVGALVARLTAGRALQEAIGWAQAAAAIAVTRAGATSSMPTAAEVEALLAG